MSSFTLFTHGVEWGDVNDDTESARYLVLRIDNATRQEATAQLQNAMQNDYVSILLPGDTLISQPLRTEC